MPLRLRMLGLVTLVALLGITLHPTLARGDAYPGSIFDLSYRHTTYKPILLGKSWMAVTGEPLSAAVGSFIFQRGGNAVDAAAAMLAAVCVLNDSVSFGGEVPILVYDPGKQKVFAINGQGIAPTGATPEFFRGKGLEFPPGLGPLAATTPGIPGALIVMLAEFGTMSLKDVLQPAIDLADGYPIELQTAAIYGEYKDQFQKWSYSKEIFLPGGKPPEPGQLFVQKELADTLRKLVEAEQQALKAGQGRKAALMAAKERFYKGDIAKEFVRGSQEYGGTHTLEDLARTEIKVEEPLGVSYRGIDVYKCNTWTQGPTLLQTLNLLEGFDLKTLKHNSPEYIHTIYQALNLAFADRDFYYGDPSVDPVEPIQGLLSKEYAADRRKLINAEKNNPALGPGDPYPYQGAKNPFLDILKENQELREKSASREIPGLGERQTVQGTTSIVAGDKQGWVVSMTPSGGWPPSFIAGKTGVGMSTRMQQFVLDPNLNPFNVVAPGKRPRITISPSLALKDGKPYLAFSLPGGDVQEQMLLQFFLNVAEFGMDVQEASEAPKFESFQMQGSFGLHPIFPGRISLDTRIPKATFDGLAAKGYKPLYWRGGVRGEHGGALSTLGINQKYGTLEGGQGLPDGQWSGVRYGIGW